MNNKQLSQPTGSENGQLPSETHRTWRSWRGVAFAGVLVGVAGILVACGGGGGSNSGSSSGAASITYTIGGMVSGLSGSGLVLQNNAGNDLAISTNGTFTFSTPLANGAAYAITVKSQPSSATLTQTCVITNGSGTVGTSNVITIAVACTTTAINGIVLPPDPGGAGKATIAGVDSDNDGVRDDVQRYIAITFLSSARHREALRSIAKVIQLELLEQTTEEAIANGNAGTLGIQCLSYLGLLRQGSWKQIDALMMNTPARLSAMEAHSARINGQVFSTLSDDQRRAACSFDVESLPN